MQSANDGTIANGETSVGGSVASIGADEEIRGIGTSGTSSQFTVQFGIITVHCVIVVSTTNVHCNGAERTHEVSTHNGQHATTSRRARCQAGAATAEWMTESEHQRLIACSNNANNSPAMCSRNVSGPPAAQNETANATANSMFDSKVYRIQY